ncbi:MAG: hypothetical protein A2Z27_00410 [candidate division Zixibacteria bacterium RBG_16_50_21]|nr:MAG: hypothetical protein A2Z27_00410 [candidate division Zixibacteria bacterium RBG_16_50_21]
MNVTINLDEQANPKYYKLWDQSNELMEKLNEVATDLKKFKYPKFFSRSAAKRLDEQGQKLIRSEPAFIKWRDAAIDFCLRPEYVFNRDEPQATAFLHYTLKLNSRVDQLDRYVNFASNLYQIIKSDLRSIQNNSRYIISTLLAIVALALAIIAL